MSEIDLSPYKIQVGKTDYPEKHDGALDAVEEAVKGGLTDLDDATQALSNQITQELSDAVAQTDDARDAAIGAAIASAGSAASSSADRVLAQTAKTQTEALKAATESAAAEARAIVVSGDVDVTPAPGKVPLGHSSGKLHSGWVQNAAYPGNHIEAGSATSGIEIEDPSEIEFTAQMSRVFTVFIPAQMSEEITVFSQGVTGIYITVDKRIRLNCFGVYESEPIQVSDNWLQLALTRDDNEQDVVTVAFYADRRLLGSIQVQSASDLMLRSMLIGEDGFSFIVSPGHAALTSAGANKAQRPGDPIGLMRDLGPNGINAAQATATARPLLGRVPVGGRRNLFLDSARIVDGSSNALAIGNYRSGSPIVTENSDGSFTIESSAKTRTGVGAFSGVVGNGGSTVIVWFDVAYVNHPFVSIRYVSPSESALRGDTVFNIQDGTVAVPPNTGSGNSNAVASISENEFGGYRIAVSVTTTSTTGVSLNLCDDQLARNAPPAGAKVKFIRGQAETGNTATPFQLTGATSLDVTESGVPDVWFAHFDGSDDLLSWSVPEITGGTIILAGTSGIWIDELNVDAGAFNIGPRTYTGGPAGILDLIGDVIGGFVICRALTQAEIDQHVARYKALGAPGVLELGPELVINGGPGFSSADGWSI